MRPLPGEALRLHTSNPGTVTTSWGGVGRNISEAAARLGAPRPILVTCVGRDAGGLALAAHCASVGIALHDLVEASAPGTPLTPPPSACRTAVYAATLNEDGDLLAAVADMAAFDALSGDALYGAPLLLPSGKAAGSVGGLMQASAAAASEALKKCSLLPDHDDESPQQQAVVVVDGNVPASGVRSAARLAAAAGNVDLARRTDAWHKHPAGALSGASESDAAGDATEPLVFLYECTSVAKCLRVVDADALHLATLIKPNRHEVIALGNALRVCMGLDPISTAEHAASLMTGGDSEAAPDSEGANAATPGAAAEPSAAVDSSVDDIIAGGSAGSGQGVRAAAAAAAAARKTGRSRQNAPPGDSPSDDDPGAVRHTVYIDRGSDAPPAEPRGGRLVGQRAYEFPDGPEGAQFRGPSASRSGSDAPADPLTLSFYQEFGAEAEAAAAQAEGGASRSRSGVGPATEGAAHGAEGGRSAEEEQDASPPPTADSSLDYAVLAAAQAVLAAMVRPGVS